jgi:hypothetical protein
LCGGAEFAEQKSLVLGELSTVEYWLGGMRRSIELAGAARRMGVAASCFQAVILACNNLASALVIVGDVALAADI